MPNNIGAFGENFPYSNQHDMNMDWVITVVKNFLDQYSHIQEIINTGETHLSETVTNGIATLNAKATQLELLLQEWYNTHSNDIANELSNAVTSFRQQAEEIVEEVIQDIPADYTELSNKVVETTRLLNYLPDGYYIALTSGRYYPMSGTTIDINNPTSGATWSSAVIPCEPDNIFLISAQAVNNPCAWAFINSSGTVVWRTLTETAIDRAELIAPEGSAYLVINNADNLYAHPTVYKYRNNYTLSSVAETLDTLITKYHFNPNTYYNVTNGQINLDNPSTGNGWTSCKAECTMGDVFAISGRSTANPPLVAFTDSTGRVIVMDSPEMDVTDIKYIAPEGCSYIIVNTYLNWYPEPECIKIFTPEQKTYIVDINGNGDYTSLTNALVSTNGDILVKAGTYDIVAEYKAKFGTNIFNLISDNYTTIGMFRYGLYVYQRKVTFETGAKIVCDLTNELVTDGTHRFSAINLGYNAEIHNINCEATGTFYLVHDDFGSDIAYTNIIDNCVLIGHNLTNHNVVGGGCRNKSTNIVKNTYMENGENNQRTLRYHNYNSATASPTIIIENCRANGYIDACYYGNQSTPKMTALVHNCESRGVRKTAETSSMQTDNVDLYAWANITNN